MSYLLRTAIASMMLFSALPASAEDAWRADLRRADLNDSGGLSRNELDKSKSNALKPFKAQFDAIDDDRDGQITAEEIERHLARGRDDFADRFRKADLNDSGGLSRKELDKLSGKQADSLRKNFNSADRDQDGQLTWAEAQTALAGGTSGAGKGACGRDCGEVVAIERFKREGESTGLGAVAGGVAGGLLGNQVGHGTGKTVATVGGAAGGAYVGSQIEKKLKTRKMVRVAVLFESGEQQDFEYDEEKNRFAVGDRVVLRDGHLQRADPR